MYRTKEPEYSHLPNQQYEWTRTVYGNVKVELPKDIPKPLGKRVVTTTFLDANLLHNIVTGKSVTAELHLSTHPNRLVFEETSHCEDSNIWFRVCSCQNCKKIMHLRNTVRYLGVCIMTKVYMFGDNKSVIMSSTT